MQLSHVRQFLAALEDLASSGDEGARASLQAMRRQYAPMLRKADEEARAERKMRLRRAAPGSFSGLAAELALR